MVAKPKGLEGANSGIGLDPTQLTPLQRLVLEEVGKILGASARRTFSTVKESSGRLPTGRTLLGTVIDPLGIFSTSTLVEVDDADERTLEAAGKLLEIVQGAGGSSKVTANVLQDITPADARKLAASVSRILWEKRVELTVLTGHLAYVMLRQTARRLEKPKIVKKRKDKESSALSDSGVVTLEGASPFAENFSSTPSTTGAAVTVPVSTAARSMTESDRLSKARIMLLDSRRTGNNFNEA
jgi:hypothetical protein